jgi:hypothetical protein
VFQLDKTGLSDMDYLKPYSYVRGFNYYASTGDVFDFWRDYNEALVERELTYAQRLGLNSARVFLDFNVYENEPQAFFNRVKHFLRVANDRGITVMPVIWPSDQCFKGKYDKKKKEWVLEPGIQRVDPDFWPKGERYCEDLVKNLSTEPGLIMWDIVNEPLLPIMFIGVPGGYWDHVLNRMKRDIPEGKILFQKMWSFVHHFCKVMKKLDTEHPITVGVSRSRFGNIPTLQEIGPDVDVLSFHDYSPDRLLIREHIDDGLKFARQFRKPILISELGCLARNNPYDVALEICQEVGIGWYLWELMIGTGYWRDVHGVVYPDGTVRDPSIVAAIRGFFRKRSGHVIAPNVDKEHHATHALLLTREWLGADDKDYTKGLRILEQIANILESGELVPMNELPSIKVLSLSEESSANRAELCRLLVLWSQTLTSYIENYNAKKRC